MTHDPNPNPPERTEPSASSNAGKARAARVAYHMVVALLLSVGWISFLLTPARPSGGLNPADFVTVVVNVGFIILLIWFVVASSTGGSRLRVVFYALIGTFSALLGSFSQLYWNIGEATHFGGTDLSKLDAVYFALGTLTTAGTGNLSATSELSRSLVAVQMVLDMALTGFAVTVVAARLSERPATAPSNPPRSSS